MVTTTVLSGMKDIRTFLGGRSEATVLDWIRKYADTIPIKKVDGRWSSERELLGAWYRQHIQGLPPTLTPEKKAAQEQDGQGPPAEEAMAEEPAEDEAEELVEEVEKPLQIMSKQGKR